MMTRFVCLALVAATLAACTVLKPQDSDPGTEAGPRLLTRADIDRLPPPPDTERIAYGSARQQFGELRLPPGVEGPFPVLVLVHGGCWGGDGSYRYLRPLAEELSTLGVATWTVEYRGLGDDGGGWPGTFSDIGEAVDHLRELAKTYPLNLKRVAVVGHGTGGHLALWAATRRRTPAGSPLHVANPLKVHAAIGLAAVTDLEAFESEPACPGAVAKLLGSEDDAVPADRRKQVSPKALLPLGVPQWYVHGARDGTVTAADLLAYAELARRKGDRVTVGVTSNAGHFEPAVPGSATWMTLQQAVVAALLQ